jgi:glucan endo-1,3-alpha-glucosidase
LYVASSAQSLLSTLKRRVQLTSVGNDYGESSYINAPISHQVVAGADVYVTGFDHTAFRFVLPYFISAYKAGNANVAVPSEGAVAWYRTTPATICSDGGKLVTIKWFAKIELTHFIGTVWGQGGGASAAGGTQDVVSIIALTNAPTNINVQIGSGDSGQSVSATSTVGKASFYEVPINGRTGGVTITLNGKSTTGPEITNSCPSSGHVSSPYRPGGMQAYILTCNRSTSTPFPSRCRLDMSFREFGIVQTG